MTTQRRTNRRKANFQLEGLERREAPTVGMSGAFQAALAHAQLAGARSSGFQFTMRALPIGRPGAAFQGSNVAFPGTPRAANPPTFSRPFNPAGRFPVAPIRVSPPHYLTNLRVPGWAFRSAMRPPVMTPPPANPQDNPVVPPNSPPAGTSDGGNALPPNVDGMLNQVYQNSLNGAGQPVFDGPGSVIVEGSNVGVNVHGNGQGDFSDFVSALEGLGMQVVSANSVIWSVEGMLPIDQLPAAAQTPQTLSITARTQPLTS